MPIVNGVFVAIPPLEGNEVDFDNPQRQSVQASYVVSSVGMFLAFLFLAQRLYTKAVVRNTFGLDVALLVLAWLGPVAIQILIIRSFALTYMGVHGWEIPFDKFQQFAFLGGYINSIVYTLPTTLSKIVILMFYSEINNPQLWWRWSIHATMFVVGGAGVGILFASIFSCHPMLKAWDLTFPQDEGSCIDRPSMYQATAGLGVATDVLIISIPIPMVLSLQMSREKKIGLIALFTIGSATVITSMVRLALLISIVDAVDQTWGGGPVYLWICVEANLLIICSSLSTLRHFINTISPRFFSSANDTGDKSKNPNYDLQTIGGTGSRNRAYYNRFDDTDIVLDTRTDVEGGFAPHDGSKLSLTRLNDVDGKSSGSDARSDAGIVQTKTTHMYYTDTNAL